MKGKSFVPESRPHLLCCPSLPSSSQFSCPSPLSLNPVCSHLDSQLAELDLSPAVVPTKQGQLSPRTGIVTYFGTEFQSSRDLENVFSLSSIRWKPRHLPPSSILNFLTSWVSSGKEERSLFPRRRASAPGASPRCCCPRLIPGFVA
eukprot:765271-Hanusia_phi.AAC.3